MFKHLLKGVLLFLLAICIVFALVDFWLSFDKTMHLFTPVVTGTLLVTYHGVLGLWTWLLFKGLDTHR